MSAELAEALLGCVYVHEPRTVPERLTDHSALSVRLDLAPAKPLILLDPTHNKTEAALS